MKKIAFTMMALLFVINANSQELVEQNFSPGYYFFGIPYNGFTNSTVGSFKIISKEGGDVLDFELYDQDFNLYKTISINPGEDALLEFLSDESSIGFIDASDKECPTTTYLTAKIFNDDENFEYIKFTDSNTFSIINDEGEILASYDAPDNYTWGGHTRLCKIRGTYYLDMQYSNSKSAKRILYKIVKGESSNIKSQGSSKTNLKEVARFDVLGHEIPASQKGINIIKMSDGSTKKVLEK